MRSSHAEDFYIRKLFEKAKIKEIMKTDVVKIREEDALSDAQERFVSTGISHLLIVDQHNKLTGLITPKYLYKAISPRKVSNQKLELEVMEDENSIVDGGSYYAKEELNTISVTSIMKKDPFTLEPENTVGEGILYMATKIVSCIPIVDEDREVVGIFTNQEIVSFLMSVLTE